MKKIIAQFIPILLIFFLFTSIKPFIQFSNTILGKLLAVLVIIFYTYIDKIIGLFVCSLVILFYQWDYVEGMENIDINQHLISNIVEPGTNEINIIDDEIYLPESNEMGDKKKYPKGISAYRWTDYVDEPANKKMVAQEEFRKENCKNGVLMYKNNEVRKDMAEFVFPELKMNGRACNPCDKTCSFSVIENKLRTEKELAPK
jgi:hypothetical protein